MNLLFFKKSILFGFISGIGCAGFFCIIYGLGLVSPTARFFDFWIPAMCMFLGLYLCRESYKPLRFAYWQAIMCANLIGLISAITTALSIYFLISFINDLPFQNYLESSRVYLTNSKDFIISKTGIQAYKQMQIQIGLVTIKDFCMDEFYKKLYYIFILAPIIAFIMKSKKTQK